MKQNRSQIIVKSGQIFILVNLLLAIFNIIIGIFSHSIAIISDSIHSLTDSIAGILVILSEKFANHRKFAQYRIRIERTTTILIAIIIIATGIHIIIESVEKIIKGDNADYYPATIVVLIASVIAKYLLAKYLKNTGKKIHSNVLIASGTETFNDIWISVAVLISAIIFIIYQINIEAYISIIIAFVIIRVGLEFIFPHLSNHHHHHLEQNPDHDHCGRKDL